MDLHCRPRVYGLNLKHGQDALSCLRHPSQVRRSSVPSLLILMVYNRLAVAQSRLLCQAIVFPLHWASLF